MIETQEFGLKYGIFERFALICVVLEYAKSPGPFTKLGPAQSRSSPLLQIKVQSVQSNQKFVHPVQAQKSGQNSQSSPVQMDWTDGLDWIK